MKNVLITSNLCILQVKVVLSRNRSPSTIASEQCNLSQSPPLSRLTPFTIGGSLRLIEQSAAPYSSLHTHVPQKTNIIKILQKMSYIHHNVLFEIIQIKKHKFYKHISACLTIFTYSPLMTFAWTCNRQYGFQDWDTVTLCYILKSVVL